MNPQFGKLLIMVGVLLVVVGIAVLFRPNIPWLGRLPGDIVIERGNTRIYFPVVTSLVVSVVMSLVMWIFRK
jgi:hypothetical protein